MFIKRVIKALNKAHINYVLVGGYAVALHGAVRGTVDLDFVIELSEKQYVNLESSLLEISLTPTLPVSAKDVYHFRDEYIANRNLVAWSFVNHANPLEVVDVIITHDAKMMKTKTIHIDSLAIHIADINELIKMKQKSARPQDIEDIKALEKLR